MHYNIECSSMAHLKIRHIGPVVNADIDLNKINVIIGPQSSGKSTICKISCFCAWVEKHACQTQTFGYFMQQGTFFNQLVVFHKLKGYFRDGSYFEYETDAVRFSYSHQTGVPEFEWKDRYGYACAKIAYIPSERNLVSAIDNWFQVKFADNNIRNFMIDWTDARKVYTKNNPLPVLEHGIQYYFDETTGRDAVVVDDKGTVLDLTDTSSGFQSIIPLKVVSEYLLTYIYGRDNANSVNDDLRGKALGQILYKERYQKQSSDGGTTVGALYNLRIFQSEEDIEEYRQTIGQLLHPQYTTLYIEEAEQNVFPLTQRDIVYYFLNLANAKDRHSLFLTTHSPYVLYALNNCMTGYLVKDKMPEEEQRELASRLSWINPASVSAYEITPEGTLRSIKNEKTGTIGKQYFKRVMNEVMDEYYSMLEYLELPKDEK